MRWDVEQGIIPIHFVPVFVISVIISYTIWRLVIGVIEKMLITMQLTYSDVLKMGQFFL